METNVFLAVLLAALLHASWNSVIKGGNDRLSSVLMLTLAQATIAVLVLPFVEQPGLAALGWLIASAALHTGYKIFLIQAYEHADLSQAYPLARGSAPMIVTVFSVLALGESIGGLALVSILVISLGIFLMAFGGRGQRRLRTKAWFYALATAGFIASYTLVDGIGARTAGTPSGYILWLAVGDVFGITLYALITRGAHAFPALTATWRTGIATGAMSLGSYWIAVWAFTQAPIALVASLRETSILFAVLIAALVLREPVSGWRWLSACMIAAGVALMKV